LGIINDKNKKTTDDRRGAESSLLAMLSGMFPAPQLSAEENLFKPIGLTGILSTTRTLDVMDIVIHG